MFQLLVFFMLSSGVTPYALLTVRSTQELSTPATQSGTDPSQAPQELPAQMQTTLWSIDAGEVSAGGQSFSLAQLPRLAQTLVDTATPGVENEVVLIVRPTALVQDIATVMAVLEASNIQNVQLIRAQAIQ